MVKRNWTFKKTIKTIWVTIGLLFTIWLFYSVQSHGVSKQLILSDKIITVESTDDYYSFAPKVEFKNVLIFYPGAMVESKAYIPLCRKITENGVMVYLIKMPWRLATNGYTKPKQLHLFADSSKTYILSGHSQGAKMAAQFVYENPELVDKLILIGTTHPRDISLADRNISVLKIYGSNDGVADEKSILENRSKLPESTKFVRIEGANHSQFGYYGFQLGDNSANISREQQQAETLNTIMEFIGK